MQDLILDDFAGSVGEQFEVVDDAQSIALTLEEASALPASIRAGGSFRLVFSGPAHSRLQQAIHHLRRGNASYEIFLVPIQPQGGGARYEAIFN